MALPLKARQHLEMTGLFAPDRAPRVALKNVQQISPLLSMLRKPFFGGSPRTSLLCGAHKRSKSFDPGVRQRNEGHAALVKRLIDLLQEPLVVLREGMPNSLNQIIELHGTRRKPAVVVNKNGSSHFAYLIKMIFACCWAGTLN